MQARLVPTLNGFIVYEESNPCQIHEHVFTPSYWRARGALDDDNVIAGRGAAWRIRDGEIDWHLRHYRRGGLVARVLRDWYLYTGLFRTRPIAEWNLLAQLHSAGLPVPKPVAARLKKGLLGYRGDLITETVPGTSLAQHLAKWQAIPESAWRAIGDTIRRLHDAGCWHADLNAHNILLDGSRVHVIDFDRSRIRPQETGWRESNLQRLRRSILKILGEAEGETVLQAAWPIVMAGYNRDQ